MDDTTDGLKLRLRAVVATARARKVELLAALAFTEAEIVRGEQMLAALGLQPLPGSVQVAVADDAAPSTVRRRVNRRLISELFGAVRQALEQRPMTKAELAQRLEIADHRRLRPLDYWVTSGRLRRTGDYYALPSSPAAVVELGRAS